MLSPVGAAQTDVKTSHPVTPGGPASFTTGVASDLQTNSKFAESAQKKAERNLQITSFALAMIALLLLSLGFGGWGLATTKSVMMSGFGFMYQFVGTHFVMLGLGFFVSSIITLIASSCHRGEENSA